MVDTYLWPELAVMYYVFEIVCLQLQSYAFFLRTVGRYVVNYFADHLPYFLILIYLYYIVYYEAHGKIYSSVLFADHLRSKVTNNFSFLEPSPTATPLTGSKVHTVDGKGSERH